MVMILQRHFLRKYEFRNYTEVNQLYADWWKDRLKWDINLFRQNYDGKLMERITINPKICHGKPTIRNMRYPVENMLELLASGMTMENLLADYPDL